MDKKINVYNAYSNELDPNCQDDINEIGYICILLAFKEAQMKRFKKPSTKIAAESIEKQIDLNLKIIRGRIRKYKICFGELDSIEYVPMKQKRISKEYGHLNVDELHRIIEKYKVTFTLEGS